MPATRHRLAPCTVHARFSLSEIPRISVAAPDEGSAAVARAAAVRALAEAGRGYLGGRVEVRTYGGAARCRSVRRAADRAVALAVAANLRGDAAGVRIRVRPPR
ncbi:hypothetical protein [Streptomyces brevispora]|uniref:Uncharacterized protein n=1 Tax=Streptomyces brevispora TaxID=887462 RepID=A0ABZ1FXY9_9ACTN|nr:hypothetical protein [Streptomyces brevispora]WSC12422.1 hypothetical protein OIE64_05900 [Streptomyces brevispora]